MTSYFHANRRMVLLLDFYFLLLYSLSILKDAFVHEMF